MMEEVKFMSNQSTQPTPPEGYRLMADEELPNVFYDDITCGRLRRWFPTEMRGLFTVAEMKENAGDNQIFYARKIKSQQA